MLIGLVSVVGLCAAISTLLSAIPGATSQPSRFEVEPLIIDLDANGFELTSLEDGVVFDLDGDGLMEETSWTSSGSRDAFLALDVNRSGRIENGRKLLGGIYGLENGFTTLARFEQDAARLATATNLPQRAGVPDALIDAADPIYDQLILWIDANHNGKAEAAEFRTLGSEGVVRLFVGYVRIGEQDRHGNRFSHVAQALVNNRVGVPVQTEVRSVRFVTQPRK
jgi:hypothetical protein